MSQEDLASRAGVARRVVQQLEAGTANPTIATLMAVAKALGTTFDEIAGHSAKRHLAERMAAEPEPGTQAWTEAAQLLVAISQAGILRQLIALYVVTNERKYLDEIRALPGTAPTVQFLQSLPRR